MDAESNNKKGLVLIDIAEIFNFEMTESKLAAYVKALQDLTVEQMQVAFQLVSRDPVLKFMPTPGHIRSLVQPILSPRQEAIQIADRIKTAVRKFGFYNGADAKLWMGEMCWGIVCRHGG